MKIASGPCSLGVGRSINFWGRALRLLTSFLRDYSKVSPRNLGKSLTGSWHRLCRTIPKFSHTQNDALRKGVARLRTLTGGSEDAAAVVAKGTEVSDPPSASGSPRSDAITGQSSSVVSDAGLVCASVPLTKRVEDVSVLDESSLEATEFNLDLCPLGPPISAVAPLSVPDRASSAVSKCIKKSAATSKSPRT